MDKTAKDRMKRYRERKRNATVTESPDNVTVSVTEDSKSVTQYPAILHALTDPIKRKKLEAIYQSLQRHNKADKVFYGFPGLGGVPFNVVDDYLEATRQGG